MGDGELLGWEMKNKAHGVALYSLERRWEQEPGTARAVRGRRGGWPRVIGAGERGKTGSKVAG